MGPFVATFGTDIRKWFRRIFGPPARQLSRAGRIGQTLWVASQIQRQQRDYLERIGRVAIRLFREGKLKDFEIERTLAKYDRLERILKRQEQNLADYRNANLSRQTGESDLKNENLRDY
jgi:ubiquinone biosynthesis protein UbiJ